jgi:DNA-binding response OmpR family regulator
VDDEPEIVDFVSRYLERDGFRVISAATGIDAVRIAREENPSLVVLDVMLPGCDGFEVVRRIRSDNPVPILMLTARDEEADRVLGLEIGADDYLTKPFSPRELTARVKALLRRSEMSGAQGGIMRFGDLEIDTFRRRVRLAGRDVDLTAIEFSMLKLMASNPGKSFTRDELLDRVWGEEYAGDRRTVDVHIRHLREKLEDPAGTRKLFRSVWGVGYRFEG